MKIRLQGVEGREVDVGGHRGDESSPRNHGYDISFLPSWEDRVCRPAAGRSQGLELFSRILNVLRKGRLLME